MGNSSNEITVPETSSLRANDLLGDLLPYLSPQVREVFKNQRLEMGAPSCFSFGRLVFGEVSQVDYSEYGWRLNRLVSMFDGKVAYKYAGRRLHPHIESSLIPPVRLSIHPIGVRWCRICKLQINSILQLSQTDIALAVPMPGFCSCSHVSSNDVTEVTVNRTMLMSYLFVDDLDGPYGPANDWNLDSERQTWDHARSWLNSLTKDFIMASRDGELPVNIG